jgi:hypothetical protein
MELLTFPPPSGNLTPRLRSLQQGALEVVRVFDRIRRRVEHDDDMAEFWWFAREYPRCYRFHVNAAEFRLKSIHHAMDSIGAQLVAQAQGKNAQTWEIGVCGQMVEQIYWDFESFLSEVSVSLDMLARVVSPAFAQQSPPSFNKLCKWSIAHPILDLLRTAKAGWVNRAKDYRDCFIHYTPVDTLLMVVIRYYSTGWQLRAKLPTNPNSREILNFRFAKRTELLRYAISTYANLVALDRRVAKLIWSLHRAGEFPRRQNNLFAVGARKNNEVKTRDE